MHTKINSAKSDTNVGKCKFNIYFKNLFIFILQTFKNVNRRVNFNVHVNAGELG